MERNVVKYNSRWFGESHHCFTDSPMSRGVSILIHQNLPLKVLNVHRSNDGRIILLNCELQENSITIVNVYAPNNDKMRIEFFNKLKSFISRYCLNDNNLIIAGDFNCCKDRKSDNSHKKLLNVIEHLNGKDMWLDLHPNLSGFTWCNANNIPASRIDYIFISKDFIYDVEKLIIRRVPGTHSNNTRMTDHRVLKFSLNMNNRKRGSGYWKLNSSILSNEEYEEGINRIIENLDSELSPLSKWESFKSQVKEFSICFSTKNKKEWKHKIQNIEKEISKIDESNADNFNIKRKQYLENQLDELYNVKTKGAQIRSKAKWINEGEKNTKFFLGLEKSHQTFNVIKELKTSDGRTAKSENEVLGEMCNYYENLYTSKNINDHDIDNYLNQCDIPKLSQIDKELCDFFPTLMECKEAVFNMKTNKSPGIDGLTGEFYKHFWNSIATLFYDALGEIFQNGELSFSQRLSVLTLIHKKDDKKDLKNYRPLSLTNTDYKIIAFIFARRLQKIINKLINPNQSAYIKGRYIGSNARLILDIYEYCENFNNDGILLFLDFEKAFDSVEWNFLYKTLENFNFGNNFIKWMKILYTNPIFRTKNNGWLSKTVNMQRGIRQGCPVSALLYILVSEILALKIKENNNIQGFSLPNMISEIKSVQHADDLTMILKNIESLIHGIETIKSFCLHAGSKINISKTECILLGRLKGTFDNIDGIKVNTSSIKCLGIYVGHDKEECYNKYWMKVYGNIEKLFESWKKRKLTIFGKCCIVNTLAISKLIYLGSILEFPDDDYLKKLNRLIFNFIWNKTERIKRNTLIAPVYEGGIGIVDIMTKLKALKASWINRLLDTKCINRVFLDSFLTNYSLSIEYVS